MSSSSAGLSTCMTFCGTTLRVWIVGTPPSVVVGTGSSASSAMSLSYRAVRGTGAQSVTADRDTRRSDGLDEYKAVRQ